MCNTWGPALDGGTWPGGGGTFGRRSPPPICVRCEEVATSADEVEGEMSVCVFPGMFLKWVGRVSLASAIFSVSPVIPVAGKNEKHPIYLHIPVLLSR